MANHDLDRAGKRRFVQAFATTMRTGGAGRKTGYVFAVVAAVVISAGAALAVGAIASSKSKASGPPRLSGLSKPAASPSSASATPSIRPGHQVARSTAPDGTQPSYVIQGGGPAPVVTEHLPPSAWPSVSQEPSATTQGAQQPAEPTPPPAPSTSRPSATATAGPLAITGQVSCVSGHSVEGVWVQAGHGSGWASWMKLGNGSTSDWWFTLPVSEPYSLHVGCGGSPASWAVSASTPLVNGPHNSFDCHDVAAAADYQKCISR